MTGAWAASTPSQGSGPSTPTALFVPGMVYATIAPFPFLAPSPCSPQFQLDKLLSFP